MHVVCVRVGVMKGVCYKRGITRVCMLCVSRVCVIREALCGVRVCNVLSECVYVILCDKGEIGA